MAILSFSITTNEFLSGNKTVTRRDWSEKQFSMWQRLWDNGKRIHDAWDNIPRAGGKFIGKFKLIKNKNKLIRLKKMKIEKSTKFGTIQGIIRSQQ